MKTVLAWIGGWFVVACATGPLIGWAIRRSRRRDERRLRERAAAATEKRIKEEAMWRIYSTSDAAAWKTLHHFAVMPLARALVEEERE